MTSLVSFTKEEDFLKIQIQSQCSIFMKIVLLTILIPCLLMPILGIVLAANAGILNIGIIIGVFIFIAIFIYPFFKITVWQFYGQEIFLIYKNKISYKAYFRFLKSQFEEKEMTKSEILFSDRELEKDERIGTLVFLDGENKLKSALKISEHDYQLIIERYNTIRHRPINCVNL